MAIPFPLDQVPSVRRFTPGAHPVRIFTALNGAETPVLLGDRITGATITASWPALPDTDAQKAWTAWTSSYSGTKAVDLPPGLLQGLALDGVTYPAYLSWTIKDEPEVNSLLGAPGYSSLSLVMRGRLLA